MKLICVIYIAIFGINVHSQGLFSVTSGNGSTVLAVGKSGILLRSENSGNTWSSSIISSSDLYSISAVNQNYRIIGDNGVFLRSVNGGLNWSSQNLASSTNLRCINFKNENTGWIVGFNGTILKTSNGGVNWTLQNSGTFENLNSVKFSDQNTGFICGSNGTVLRTTNGGTQWQIVQVPVMRDLISIDLSSNTVIASGKYSTVIKSTDLGVNWQTIDYKMQTYSDVNSIHMFDQDLYFSCGGGGFIRKSIDGGSTFTFSLNPMFNDLYLMYFYNPSKGWAVSRKTYAVIKTTDGGATWQLPAGTSVGYQWIKVIEPELQNSYMTGSLLSFNKFNPEVLYTSMGNKVYRSFNSGINWTIISVLPYTPQLTQRLIVSESDTNKMIILVHAGTTSKVFRTSNYGSTWVETFSGNILSFGMPMEYHPVNPDTLYLGVSSKLYKSTDFGLNWTHISTLPISRFCDISILKTNPDIIIVNSFSPGRTFRSSDGGFNFTLTDSDTTVFSESPSICYSLLNETLVYHTFYNSQYQGGIRKSTDYGLTWDQFFLNMYSWGMDIAKDDPNVIVVGNALGNFQDQVFISSNGGTGFFEVTVNGGVNNSIFAFDRGNIFTEQYNKGIFKLSVNYNVPSIGIQNIGGVVPDRFLLSQNYPNPFNPVTYLEFAIPNSSIVKLVIYDIQGRIVETIVNGELSAGNYKADWNASNYSSGVYFYKLETDGFTETKKMLMIK